MEWTWAYIHIGSHYFNNFLDNSMCYTCIETIAIMLASFGIRVYICMHENNGYYVRFFWKM